MAEYGVFDVVGTNPVTLELVERGFKDWKAARKKMISAQLVGPGKTYYLLRLIGAMTYSVSDVRTITEASWEMMG